MIRRLLGLHGAVLTAALACTPTPTVAPPDDEGGAADDAGESEAPDAIGKVPPVVDLALVRAHSGHVMAPVTFGTERYEMIVDTGASTSVITPKTRDALGFAETDGIAVHAQGANGSIGEVRVITLNDLELGPRTYPELMAAVMPLSHMERDVGRPLSGILGRNFLVRHRVELDFPAERMRLHPKEDVAPSMPPGSQTVATTEFEAGGLTRLELVLDGGAPIPAVFDLGAARTVINEKAAEAIGVKTGDPRLNVSAEPLLGADGKPMPTAKLTVSSLKLGAMELGPTQVYVADIGVFATLGVSDEPAMIFGVDQIDDRRVLLDYPGQTLTVSPAP